uniref:FUZ/MON1/HPS1 third Longin domain-containing protein n=1 Tax=Timema cristinae TaxID=61476 RepID=A0A7R9CQA5_TIMCR|nr:unnamed protein product [Timema cristinae]
MWEESTAQRKLIETCFPKTSPSKVRCYELYCIHLGLATSSCVLEHSRRLAATIWEVTGVANNPLDILYPKRIYDQGWYPSRVYSQEYN